jgi:hypothetical protein
MNLPKSIRAKFAEISRICEPAGFETLVDIAISYSDLIVSCIEVSNKDRSYSIDILHEIVELGNFIRQTIVESYRMRLFEESESLREIKGSSKKANELAHGLSPGTISPAFGGVVGRFTWSCFASSRRVVSMGGMGFSCTTGSKIPSTH